ncbi:hypothetical protein IED13_00930 [Bosea sp. SSUT16]|uniref:Transposase DDE domain-containing protein n=1 Tax=Bosea spartocytisi TaxID=2773451 RepID=A0A927HYD5_9HYPH|nr:hypothetical protein [Bosea spartocytisi]MBD3844242.1 hypothetical protein [Bosea spartocytisi]MCT4470651.1 hypothetical protein [Bosea spartocytisi]
MNAVALESFNTWIGWAQCDLRSLPTADEAPKSRSLLLSTARHSVRHALVAANKLGCSARKALCLRVLNWIAADMRRLPS